MCQVHTLVCSVERKFFIVVDFHGWDIPYQWAQMGVHCSHGPRRGTCMPILLDWYLIAVITIIVVLIVALSDTTGEIEMRPPFLIGLPQGGTSRSEWPFQIYFRDGRGVELTGKSYHIWLSNLLMFGIFCCRGFSASSLCRIFSFSADTSVCRECVLLSSCISAFQTGWFCCWYRGV